MGACPACGHENRDAARFCEQCGIRLEAAPAGVIRKTVTAVFCDLVGSTTLGEGHDPEVLRPLLRAYFEQMREAVERHGGRVEKFIGDAVAAVFGLPIAHEDDALRAVRAGLEMQERLHALNEASAIPLACRIGITTGEVLVPADGTPIIGDAMNTASRLQSGAEPGGVWIGEPTFRLVRHTVVAEPVEPVQAKGKAEPVPAWRVLRVQSMTARAETPLVGRDRHLAMLGEALRDAMEARAPVLVTILAPPGVGKSRLAAEFRQTSGDIAAVLIGQTPSYGDGVTFAALVELLSQAAGRPGGEAEEVAERLRSRLVGQPDGAAVGDRLAQFLGVGEAVASEASWAVRRLLEVVAAERPLVVLLEDLHWAQRPMLDLTDAVVERIHGPVLFLCLARPEFLEQRPTWAAGKPRAITTTLPPLSPADERWMAGHLLGSAPEVVVDRVCEAAEGNPLYLEQLTATLEDQGLLVDGSWLGSADARVEVPTSLQALLAARLDRLNPAPRLVLERASVEGRQFRIAAVRALAPDVPPEGCQAALELLERRGLIQPEDEAAGSWRFAHALVMEAAYRGLSKQLRADLHERLAEWLSREDTDQPEVEESVARHLERSVHLREELGVRDERTAAISARAGELFGVAGSRAIAALDYTTAADLHERATGLLPPGSPHRLDLLLSLAVALQNTGRVDEADRLLSEGLQMARSAGTVRDVLRARVTLLVNRFYRSPSDAELRSAAAEAREAFRVFESAHDDVGAAVAAAVVAWLEHAGESRARVHSWILRALRLALAAGLVMQTSEAAANFVASACAGPLPYGKFPAAAAELASLSVDPICQCSSHALLTVAALASGQEAAASEHERRFRQVVGRHGLTGLGAQVLPMIAEAEVWAGAPEVGERRLREAREVLASGGDNWSMSWVDGLMCSAVWAQDRAREFLRLADAFEASAFVADRAIRIRRQTIRARAQLLRGRTHEAEISARRGVEVAAGTDLLEEHAQALLALAEVLQVRGRGEESAAVRCQAIDKLAAKGNLAAVALLRV